MAYVLFALVWILNFAISVWNAYAVGKVWVEARHEGGWHRFMCWMGAIMSASGFSWCYLSFLALTAAYFELLNERETMVALNLGYILLLPFMLFAGYAITLDSWGQAYRHGGFLNYGAAAWNTYASIHNTYSAWRNMGGAFASLGNYLKSRDRSSSDRDGPGAIIIIILIVALALLGGVITTVVIIRRVAGTDPLPPRPDDSPPAHLH